MLEPCKILSACKYGEVGAAAKLGCAVEYAGLAARQQRPHSVLLDRRKDFEYRVAYQVNHQGRSKEWQDNGLIFTTTLGTPLNISNLTAKHFKPALQRAGLPKTIRLYDLRHTCATLLLSAGENPKVVSERLGHASIILTLDVYSHALPDMQKAATDKLENILFRRTGTL